MECTHNMKMTPVGLIPEDWDVATIKDFGHLLSDGINPQQYRDKDFVEYSMPAYDDGQSPTKCKGADMNSNRTQIKGEVLLFNKLNVRQKRVWYIENAPSNALCSMEFLAYSSDKVDLRLLREILLQDSVTKGFESVSRGTSNSQKRIAPSDFLNFSFALPPLAEQHRIADALSDVDDMIGALDEAIAKKRQIKDGLMQQLLAGKTRLPGFNGEWEDIPFKSIYKYAKEGGTPSTGVAEYYNPAIVPFAKIEDLKDKYLTRVESYISESGVEHSSAWLIPVNSVILSNGATLGEVSINKITTTTKQGILGIILKEDFSPEFIYYLFKGRSFRREMEKVTTHGTMDCAYLKDLNTISLRIPPLTEQEAIASVISSVDKEIVGLESQRDKYALIKQGMMQELLTGKTRLI